MPVYVDRWLVLEDSQCLERINVELPAAVA